MKTIKFRLEKDCRDSKLRTSYKWKIKVKKWFKWKYYGQMYDPNGNKTFIPSSFKTREEALSVIKNLTTLKKSHVIFKQYPTNKIF